jgi:hypothetical protein
VAVKPNGILISIGRVKGTAESLLIGKNKPFKIIAVECIFRGEGMCSSWPTRLRPADIDDETPGEHMKPRSPKWPFGNGNPSHWVSPGHWLQRPPLRRLKYSLLPVNPAKYDDPRRRIGSGHREDKNICEFVEVHKPVTEQTWPRLHPIARDDREQSNISGAPQAQWHVPSDHQEDGHNHEDGGILESENTLVGWDNNCKNSESSSVSVRTIMDVVLKQGAEGIDAIQAVVDGDRKPDNFNTSTETTLSLRLPIET